MTARIRQLSTRTAMAAALAAAFALTGAIHAQDLATEQRALSVQQTLRRLTSYGVFDFLTFNIDRGKVTLAGYAYSGTLRRDAEKAVKRVAGIDEVDNRIQLLPASLNDDRIRRATFYSIYTDSFLSRYAAGGAQAAHYEAIEFGSIPGRQPFGDYPIHIIVDGGRTTLFGMVDSASDKRLAEFRAREVGGVFAVNSELLVAKKR
jgi:hyperosmotically inducible protein